MITNQSSFFAPVPATASRTSRAAARQITETTATKRRREVLLVLRATFPRGLARFQIAEALGGIPESWITSSVDALRKLGEVEETNQTILNPLTGKHPAVLVARPWVVK